MQIQCPNCHEWIESDIDLCPHCQYILNTNDDSPNNVLEDEVLKQKMNEYKEMDKYRVDPDFECNMACYNMSDDARKIAKLNRTKFLRIIWYTLPVVFAAIFMAASFYRHDCMSSFKYLCDPLPEQMIVGIPICAIIWIIITVARALWRRKS